MRYGNLTAVVAMTLLLGACAAENETDRETSLVSAPGTAPYYTVLADALEAAGPGQYVVADFYTDW
jgi:hypothetical protein